MSGFPNRTPIRESVAARLAATLSGVAHVESYLVADPGDNTPLVYVTSANAAPDPDASYGGRLSLAGLAIGIWTLYAQTDADGIEVWTPEQCEAQSDLIQKIVYDTIRDNDTLTDLWSELYVEGVSLPGVQTIAGRTYRIEVIPVVARATAA